ncbi:MAG: purine-nucleoside phosphorylase [Gemmataceae bacterium]|nr:purine-nucleoside phosphorylase [Gemmataceae bacterium]
MNHQLRDYAEMTLAARGLSPRVALVLGSGLNDVADRLTDAVELPFGSVPDMGASSVPGHRGVLLLGRWVGVPVLVFAGRLHYYEGYPWRRVVQPIHIAHELGASILMATNAAGGIRADLAPGDLMAITGHIDATRPNWWQTLAVSNSPYAASLRDILHAAATSLGFSLPVGVYAQLTGPNYETPAEIRAFRTMGADAVGMSTGREIEIAAALGMECAALSCITNKAAGLGEGPIHHAEVIEAGQRVKARLIALLEAVLKCLAERDEPEA